MGSPLGGSFFRPYMDGEDGIFESLASNVLRSLQFSYVLMKGFSSTSRALKDVGRMSERGFGSSRPGGGGVATGRCCVGSSRVDLRIGGSRKRHRGTRSNFETRAAGKDSGGKKGATADSGEPVGAGGTKTIRVEGGVETIPGEPTKNVNNNSSNGSSKAMAEDLSIEGNSNSAWDIETRLPAETVLVSRFTSHLTNRTLSITGLVSVDGVSMRLKPMGKGFAKGVKMASGVVKGVKTATGVLRRFQTPAESVLMGFGAANGVIMGYEAAKFIVSSAKISKDFVSVWKLTKVYRDRAAANAATKAAGGKTIRERLAKGLKVSDGALTLVKLTREFGGGMASNFPSSLSNWDMIAKTYEVSSGVLKVSEVALGWKGGLVSLLGKGFVGVKGAISGMGVVVKTVVLTKEISVVILKGVGLWKGFKKAFKVIAERRKTGEFPFLKPIMQEVDSESILGPGSISFSKNGDTSLEIEFLLRCIHPYNDNHEKCTYSCSLLVSLASLLLADFEVSKSRESEGCGSTCFNNTQPYFFSLALSS